MQNLMLKPLNWDQPEPASHPTFVDDQADYPCLGLGQNDAQSYSNCVASSLVLALDWKHLGFTSKGEYETRTFDFLFPGIYIWICYTT